MLRRHVAIAVAFAALPAFSKLVGGGLDFTMYASTVEFRLQLLGSDADGRPRVVPPSSLAFALPPSARGFVAGADHFRRSGGVLSLRRHLGDLGQLACHEQPALTRVTVTLFERSADHRDGTKESSVEVPCSR